MIVTFGTYEAARHPRIAIIVDGLRVRGYEVVEVNHPLGLSTAERVRMLRQPWRLPILFLRLARAWSALVRDTRRLRREGHAPSTVLVGYMGHFDVFLARALYRRTPIVLDHLIFAADTARDRGTRGMKLWLLEALDRAALGRADVVVVDTEEHRQMLPEPTHGVVVPVGARSEWYAAAGVRGGRRAGGLSIVFFGLFTPLQGATVIAQALADVVSTDPTVKVTLIGSGQDSDRACKILGGSAQVTWHEWVAPEDLPGVVAAHDVCLGIFADTPKALRVVPNKVYEGIAAGCAVVTSDTAPQRRMVGEYVALVPPADPGRLAAQLRRLASDPEELERLRSKARSGARRFDAGQIVAPLLEALSAHRGASS